VPNGAGSADIEWAGASNRCSRQLTFEPFKTAVATYGEGVLVRVSDEIDPKDPSARRAIEIRPSGMNPGVAADKSPIVHGESMRVR
jgi:hypothetical protein